MKNKSYSSLAIAGLAILLAIACLAGLVGIAVYADAADGVTLYAQNCSGCHGLLASSSVKGASAGLIQNAINSNTGGMGSLSSLTPTDIQAIAAALSPAATPPPPTTTPPPTTPPPTADGAALYGQYCASCHGPLASSAKAGANAARIQGAINTIGTMNGLSSLTAAQVQAIATALGQQTPPPPPSPPTTNNGAALYSQFCAGCHGPLDSSAKKGATASRIENGINAVGSMNGLKMLSQMQIKAIADALATASAAAGIPLPTGGQIFTSGPVVVPVVSTNPAQAIPVGIGSLGKVPGTIGNNLIITVETAQFAGPVDVSLAVYDTTFDADELFFLDGQKKFTSLSDAVEHQIDTGSYQKTAMAKEPVIWKGSVFSLKETVLGPIPTSQLPPGLYILHLNVTPAGHLFGGFHSQTSAADGFYRWVTYFIVP
ncbi:MAG: c-type cytochrome [Nitrospiraceae bacterium]|nr:c-type cytochrome [Nitrospiraceae bacterium]